MRKMVAVRTSAAHASPARTSAKGRRRRSGKPRGRDSALMPTLLISLARACAPVLLRSYVHAARPLHGECDPPDAAGLGCTPTGSRRGGVRTARAVDTGEPASAFGLIRPMRLL